MTAPEKVHAVCMDILQRGRRKPPRRGNQMSMNIKIEFKNKYNLNKNNYWIDPTKLQNYTLPTFTKKIVKFLESHK